MYPTLKCSVHHNVLLWLLASTQLASYTVISQMLQRWMFYGFCLSGFMHTNERQKSNTISNNQLAHTTHVEVQVYIRTYIHTYTPYIKWDCLIYDMHTCVSVDCTWTGCYDYSRMCVGTLSVTVFAFITFHKT